MVTINVNESGSYSALALKTAQWQCLPQSCTLRTLHRLAPLLPDGLLPVDEPSAARLPTQWEPAANTLQHVSSPHRPQGPRHTPPRAARRPLPPPGPH